MRERRHEGRIVGRDADIERIVELAHDRGAGAVLLTGASGVGVSRLAEAGMNALADRGRTTVGLSATRAAADIAFAALSELIPSTLDRLRDLDRHAGDIAVLRAVEDALAVDESEPAVVLLDEIAEIDAQSCNVIVHLATNRRVFVIATQHAGPDVAEAIRRLTPAGVVELEIGPLDLPGTAELTADLCDGQIDPGLVREVWGRTRGSPSIVRELVNTGLADGSIRPRAGVFQLSGQLAVSAGLGRQILNRLGVLSGDERVVLELLAVGGELHIDVVADAVDEAVLDALDRRGVISIADTGTGLRASIDHPLLADAVLADMTALAQRRRHRELVELLDGRHDETDADRVLLALARVGSGVDIDVDELLAAARIALRRDRIRDAAQLAQEAFRRRPDEATRELFAESRIRQGRFIEADELLAEPLADDAHQWDRMRRAIRRSSNQLWGFRDATAAWQIDADCLPTLTDPDAIERVVAHQAWVAYCDGRPDEAIALTDELTDNQHPDVRFAVAAARAPALVIGGRIEDGVALAQRAWDGEWGADTEYGSHGQHLIALGFGTLYLGDLDTTRWIVGEAMRVCRDRSETTALLFFLDLAAWTELLAGELATATSYFAEAADIATELAITTSVRASLCGIAITCAQRGDPDDTTAAWQRVLDIPDAPGPRAGFEIGVAEAWHVATAGDPAKAADILRSVAEEARSRGLRVLEALALLDVARLGYAERTDAERADELAARSQGPLVAEIADLVTAAADRDGGRLLAVAGAFDERGFTLIAAEMAAFAADLSAGAGDQKSAAAAQAMSTRVRRRVESAATPLLRRSLSVEPLTRREREIAGRAASGVSNADIADQLHVSVRTVETHLQRAYRKLGVSSRRELAAVLD